MTSSDLVLEPTALAFPADLRIVAEEAQAYVVGAKAASTRRVYARDWQAFQTWCDQHQLVAMPASVETVALYLTERARDDKIATLRRRLSSISVAHQYAGQLTPTRDPQIGLLLEGIGRKKGTAPERKAAAVTDDLKAMLAALPKNGLQAPRDRALLLLGFAGAFRRSELVALNVVDVQRTRQGLIVTIQRSKTDQTAQGQVIGITPGKEKATCPVRALAAWLSAAGITEGPIFRSVNRYGKVQSGRLTDQSVALIVKRCAAAAGLEPDLYAGHSLRAGLATAAIQGGASEHVAMKQTRHKSQRVFAGYVRDAELFTQNALNFIDL